MFRFLIYFALLILLMIFLWGNMNNKASLTLLGEPIFRDVPVLIIILGSMLGGMLLMLPFVYSGRLRLIRKMKSRNTPQPEADPDKLKNRTASEMTGKPAAAPEDRSSSVQ